HAGGYSFQLRYALPIGVRQALHIDLNGTAPATGAPGTCRAWWQVVPRDDAAAALTSARRRWPGPRPPTSALPRPPGAGRRTDRPAGGGPPAPATSRPW